MRLRLNIEAKAEAKAKEAYLSAPSGGVLV